MALNSIWARIRGSANGHPSFTRTTVLNLIGFATWIPVIAWFNLHVAELTVIDGSSMYPFMNTDRDSSLRRDVVLNYKWSPQEDLQRGMVVTLRLVDDCFVSSFRFRTVNTEHDNIKKLITY